MNTNTTVQFLRSKAFLTLIVAVFGTAMLIATFSAGVAVGYHKAKFSYEWGENYHRNFGGPRGGFMGNMMRDVDGRDFVDAHGVFGKVIKIDAQSLEISGRDSLERVVLVSPGTVIRKFRDDVALSDIRVGDTVVVVGTPDQQGGLQAQLIRIMPPMSSMMASPTAVPIR